MEEATAEASHKGWCDTELATNEHTRKEKTEAVETLHANIDDLTASITLLTEEVTELSNAVADLDAAVAKATKMREEGVLPAPGAHSLERSNASGKKFSVLSTLEKKHWK